MTNENCHYHNDKKLYRNGNYGNDVHSPKKGCSRKGDISPPNWAQADIDEFVLMLDGEEDTYVDIDQHDTRQL